MTTTRKSCVVAFPKECNYATSLSTNATSPATVSQPASLKALAVKVLTRNQQCNRDATNAKQQCNFPPEHHNKKLHGFATRNQDATTGALPSWCCADCPGLEAIPLPNEGETAGCVHPITGTWRRLDRLTECPAMEKATRPSVPSWCSARCEHFHKLVVPDLGTALWCCWEDDSTNWRRLRIDAMDSCPMEEKP